MFFQAILCISTPEPKRNEADRKGRWHLRAPSVHVGQDGCNLVLSHPDHCCEGLVESNSRLLRPPRARAAGKRMSVQCVLQTIADSRRMVVRRVWRFLPNTAAEPALEQQPSAWVSPGLFLSFPSSSACHCPRLVFSSLLVSLSPLPTCCFLPFSTPDLFGSPLHVSLSFNA